MRREKNICANSLLFLVLMAEQIARFEKLLRSCEHIHAQFNFTALQGLDVNETASVLPLLFGNYSALCVKYVELRKGN